MSGPAAMAAAYNALMVGNENDLTHYGIEEDELTRVGARDADIVWLELDTSEAAASGGPFPQIDASEFSYEIFVYEGNLPRCVMQHRCSANGATAGSSSNSPSSPSPSASNGFCCLTRLKPATEYMVNIRASLPERELAGNLSQHTPFRTLPSKPEPPQMPKCLNRQATAATIAWRMPLVNGSHINAYFLQISKGKSSSEPFETCYEGLNEQFRITNLEPGACYRVRVIARNDFGMSEPSAALTIYMLHHTSGPINANTSNYSATSSGQQMQHHHHNPHRQQAHYPWDFRNHLHPQF
uniref:Fibronectin type-III domain-containing protein n=1 Tax=Ditylenchus dipsaci TaxID=166011 RepID=A0A915CX49_9BILA